MTTDPRERSAQACEITANPGLVLAVLVVGTVLAPLDSSIVNIALPGIASQFGERLGAVSWVTTAYLLTTASLLLSMGRLGDVWGLRRLYTLGLVIFGAGSAACAISPSLAWLIASRIFQAIGASMLFAAGPALVARSFPPNRRGWALGYIALAVSLGLTLGPALGGVLVGQFGWPSIFLINIPLSFAVAALAWRLLVDECLIGESFDILGAVLAGGALLVLLLGLGEAERAGLFSVSVAGPVLASAALVTAFLWWERRTPSPIVDLSLFRVRAFSAGVGAATLAYLSLFAITFTLPFYLLRVLGMEPRAAGLLLTVTPLAMAGFAPIAGRTSDKAGSRTLSTVGLALQSVGLFGASFLGSGATAWQIGLTLFVVGSGMAVFQTPNTASVLRAVPPRCAGIGSAFVAEARNVGMAVGIALTAAIVGSAIGGTLPGGEGVLPAAASEAFLRGMSGALRAAAVISIAGAAVSWYGREAEVVEGASRTH